MNYQGDYKKGVWKMTDKCICQELESFPRCRCNYCYEKAKTDERNRIRLIICKDLEQGIGCLFPKTYNNCFAQNDRG